ncbi:hypothetical protein C8J57DRAFT_1563715 [Mycena rebaudengoi]|nr:hypothetical protein C8J57DRAFT_1563715 [Mycena rebaudengoi]
MHRAWDIVEVVHMICEHIALDGPTDSWNGRPVERYPQRRRDLSRLARTSTIFMNSALDFLWRYQGTLLHLLRTMPHDVWDITETRFVEDDDEENMRLTIVRSRLPPWQNNTYLTQGLRRIVTNADWARFIFYSRRVRSFTDNHVVLEASEVYETLAASFPQDFIFPGLQTLDWYPMHSELFHHVRLFLSPGLTGIHLTMHRIPDALIFETLTAKFRGLKHVSIAGSAGPTAILSISRFICALWDVETLVVADLDSVAYSHIARFPRLRYLWLMSGTAIPYLQPPTDLPHFPAFRTLECESIEHAPALFAVRYSLVEFSLIARSWPATPTKRIVQELYSALATNCTHSSLQKICVQKQWDSDAIHPDQLTLYLVSGEELKPLFYFRNLVVVSLSHTGGVDLDDEVVLIMARAWPRLESLLFPSDYKYRINPRITLEGLYALAKHCSRLQSLAILFDATIVPELKIGSKLRISQARLVELNVAYSSLGTKWRHVAEFLGAIFPYLCLGGIQTMYQEHPQSRADAQVVASHEAWMKVNGAL